MVNINSTLVWEIINFLVLLWLLKRYLYEPVTEILDKRARKIESDLEDANLQKVEAEKNRQKYEQDLKNSREKAQQIIEDAEERAKQRAREIVEEARQEAEMIKKRNQGEIAQAKEDAMNELRRDVASISLLAASKFMMEKLDQSKHEQLINQFIENLDGKKLGEIK